MNDISLKELVKRLLQIQAERGNDLHVHLETKLDRLGLPERTYLYAESQLGGKVVVFDSSEETWPENLSLAER